MKSFRLCFHSALTLGLVAGGPVLRSAQAQQAWPQWVASWATSMQAPEPENNQPGVDPAKLSDATVRQVVHLSAGGTSVRVHVSNALGTQPLVIDAAHIAVAAKVGAIDPATDHALLFAGQPVVTIPIGAEMTSDPVAMAVKPLSDLAITMHLPVAPAGQSAHPGSRATSYLLHGLHVSDQELPGAEALVRWFQLSEVDVLGAARETIVAFGDSITDGHAATTDGNDRWPDELARRMAASTKTKDLAVVNEGIGGNHLLTNGLGVNALERLDRDLIAVGGVRYVLVLEGINDLGMLVRAKTATPEQHAELVRRMEQVYAQIVERAHAHGIQAIGGTLTPFVGGNYYPATPVDEADRIAVNEWIRQPGHFDAVVDFDKAVRDPADPSRMLPAYDSGDHLHPGPAGYKVMGDAIPLELFR